MFILHNSRGSSNIDLKITNNSLIAYVHELKISKEGSFRKISSNIKSENPKVIITIANY